MKLRIFLFASILTISLAACNQNNLPNNEVGNESTNDQNRTEIDVEQSSYEQNNQYSNNEIATHLANIAADVPDVNDAVAIIAGPYAVVGIDINEETDREQVGTIKYAVSEALRNDPYGKTAVVIADADMMQRLREMNMKMRQGHPVQGITEELAEISVVICRLFQLMKIDQKSQVTMNIELMNITIKKKSATLEKSNRIKLSLNRKT